jgi:hypothetical protein
MVFFEVLAGISVIFGYLVNGVQAGASLLNSFFQLLPDKMKHIVMGGLMIGGGVFWLEMTNALGFKLLFFGMDLTIAPMAVAIALAFLAISTEILQWYQFWNK